jgi:hypothetical protein
MMYKNNFETLGKGETQNGVRARSTVSKKPRKLTTTRKSASAAEIYHSTLRASGVSHAEAKRLSGTGHGAPLASIEQQREKALKALNITLESQFKTLKTIRDSKNACNSDRIHSVKTINSMVPGWTAPEQVNVHSTGVFMELSGLSSRELSELAGLLQVETKEIDCVVSD